ncbi:hypothetical protein EYF80_042718 [Liparis tanakae]|uniref:Uncharacterized protein n=1 Tax=Liparis tanakae TaxID=230148 RepID=A0A4Z2G2G7_9TELE|nr:hypothetical protein EYF80_042718 [Liparis tanakae]
MPILSSQTPEGSPCDDATLHQREPPGLIVSSVFGRSAFTLDPTCRVLSVDAPSDGDCSNYCSSNSSGQLTSSPLGSPTSHRGMHPSLLSPTSMGPRSSPSASCHGSALVSSVWTLC